MKKTDSIRVWDPLLRLFHWLLVVGFVVGYFTQTENYQLHLYAGYGLLGLLCWRLLWGLAGTRTARFSSFLFRPATVLAYLHAMLRGQPPRYLGHNPAGGIMILLMLLCLLVISLSGIALDAGENRAGPLGHTRLFLYTDLIGEVHVASTNIALALIALHLLGVLYSSLAHRENLVLSMITGRKPASRAPITEE